MAQGTPQFDKGSVRSVAGRCGGLQVLAAQVGDAIDVDDHGDTIVTLVRVEFALDHLALYRLALRPALDDAAGAVEPKTRALAK